MDFLTGLGLNCSLQVLLKSKFYGFVSNMFRVLGAMFRDEVSLDPPDAI